MKTTRRNFIKGAVGFVAGLGLIGIPKVPEAEATPQKKELYGRSIGLEYSNNTRMTATEAYNNIEEYLKSETMKHYENRKSAFFWKY